MAPVDLNQPRSQYSRTDSTLDLSLTTWALTERLGQAGALVWPVWRRLHELAAAGQDRRVLAALRYTLVAHQPTETGRCLVCARRWGRRRRWPCVLWRQVFHELVGRD